MDISIDNTTSGYTLIKIAGELTLYNSNELIDQVRNIWLSEPNHPVILDMENLNYIDSSGVGALIYIYSELAKKQKIIFYTHIQLGVHDVLRLSGLDTYLPLQETVQTARQVLVVEQP